MRVAWTSTRRCVKGVTVILLVAALGLAAALAETRTLVYTVGAPAIVAVVAAGRRDPAVDPAVPTGPWRPTPGGTALGPALPEGVRVRRPAAWSIPPIRRVRRRLPRATTRAFAHVAIAAAALFVALMTSLPLSCDELSSVAWGDDGCARRLELTPQLVAAAALFGLSLLRTLPRARRAGNVSATRSSAMSGS